MKNQEIPTITLNNEVVLPQFGLGVWKMSQDGEVQTAVKHALESGHRLIDTAAAYGDGESERRPGLVLCELGETKRKEVCC